MNEDEKRRPPVITADTLRTLTGESDLIFVGTVVSLGKQPTGWSGFGSAFQTVNYKIDRILKGEYTQPEISVQHVVVSESLTAREGEEPGLSVELFATQAKLIVSAQKAQGNVWKSLSEDQGALPATAEYLQKMEAALR